MIQDLIKALKKVYEEFGNKNLSICGSLVDYYWIGYEDVKDIDLLVHLPRFKEYFEIDGEIPDQIELKGFKIENKKSDQFAAFEKTLYQGTFLDTKIDLFLVPELSKIDRDIIFVDGSILGINKCLIDSKNQRIKILEYTLSWHEKDYTAEWQKAWVKSKQEKAIEKLTYYNQK